MENQISIPVANFADLLLDAICMVDANGHFVFASAACERIFGYTQEEMVGRVMIDMVAPADRERTLAMAHAIMGGQPCSRFENRYVRKDGSLVHIMWTARWSEADQLRIAVARDISASKQAEAKQAALYSIAEAAHATEDLQVLFRHIHQIIGNLLPASCVAIALKGAADQPMHFAYQADERGPAPHSPIAHALCEQVLLCGHSLQLPRDPVANLPEALHAAAGATRRHWIGVPLGTPQGDIGALVLRSGAGDGPYTEQDRDLLLFVSVQVATAIQRKRLHTRLHYMAQHDELTQLPNRRLFHDRLGTAFARAQRQHGRLALLFIDLNKFKRINDQFGHVSGDILLQQVARRLQHCVRETDTVARLGGDEFVVLLENVTTPENVTMVEEKIHHELNTPIHLADGRNMYISASIGVAHFPEHGGDIQQLLRHADQAMYASKIPCAAEQK